MLQRTSPSGAGRSALVLALGAALLVVSCGGGGGSGSIGGGGGQKFQLLSMSVQPGAVWEINRPIELRFNQPVDFSTVSLQTIGVHTLGGQSAKGSFSFKPLPGGGQDTTTVVFQPKCPTQADLSDAGFQPAGTTYEIKVLGKDASPSATTVKSALGAKLENQQLLQFTTPPGTDPKTVFVDVAVGPPAIVPSATFIELGDGQELFFTEVSPGTFELATPVPLNLFSDPATSVTFVVALNQPVDPSLDNVNDDRLRVEFQDAAGVWVPIESLVELTANCAGTGATVRVQPMGILPQASQIRLTLLPGFSDLPTLDTVQTPQSNFRAPTLTVDFESLTPPDAAADEVFEDFLVGGTTLGSLEDTTAIFDTPTAEWQDGQLTAAFDFEGTGGPGGNFDWHVTTDVLLDTVSTQIIGGPDGAPVSIQQVVNGVIDVRNLHVFPSGSITVTGPNPVKILASGDVTLEGPIFVNGGKAKDIFTIYTPTLPEPGALGVAGGGQGGTASFLTTSSTPRGGPGFGAFGLEGGGGQGGETGFSASGAEQRRGAGGGGGRFGPDESGSGAGFVAEAGADGHPAGFGAEDGQSPANGGAAGQGPFSAGGAANDFWGKKAEYDEGTGELTGILNGEIADKLAGAGGGAGGDSIDSATFPSSPFGPPFGPSGTTDQKGAGGGGGGGQIHIQALGKVIFKAGGQITANGGGGGTGENPGGGGFTHLGGSSGGGSGGHIVIETATQVDFSGEGTIVGAPAEDMLRAAGGLGGAGAPTGGYGKGGNGGPGVIQLHTPEPNEALAIGTDPTSPIRLPIGVTQLAAVSSPTAHVLVPSFGARSKARSRWISLGAASQTPLGVPDPILFTFDGIVEDDLDPDAGKVEAAGGVVLPQETLLGPEPLGTAAPAPHVDVDGVTLVLSAASLTPLISDPGTATEPSNDIYLRNPALLKSFVLRLESGATSQEFSVASATYDDTAVVLRVTVDPAGPSLASFVDDFGATNVSYTLRKRYFRVVTGGVPDSLPDTAFVKILFQAADSDALGQPGAIVQDWTADVSKLSALPGGSVDFFRFEVEFDLDAQTTGVSKDTDPVTLDFLKVPFQF